MDFHFQPIPHDEAIHLISKMPAVSREVYDELIPELKAAVFTVKGIALAKDREAIRDLIAAKFDGTTTYEAQKRKVIAVLKANDFKDKAAERRAEFLLRHWTGVAYSAARYRLAMTNAEAFPWWQYLSMGDTRVRATHGVLNLKIIRYDSPFWETHLPPWEPMCRCSWRELSDFDLEEIIKEDADKPIEQRRFLEGPILKKLETDNSLMGSVNLVTYKDGLPDKSVWTPMLPHDLRTPEQKGQNWTGWSPRNIVPSKADLEKMLKPESVKEVMDFAKTKEVEGATVAEWIEGKPQAARKGKGKKNIERPTSNIQPRTAEPKKPAPVEPASALLKDQVRAKLSLETGNPDMDRKITEACGFIASVHSISGTMTTPVRKRSMAFEALYDPRYKSDSAKASRPDVFDPVIYLKDRKEPNRTDIIHEVAHKIEGEAIAVRFSDLGDPEYIHHAKAWQAWQKIVTALADTPRVNEINYSGLDLHDKHYLTNRCELFARGYVQYITRRAGDAGLTAELDAVRERYDGLWQWPDEEFDPIVALYDALLRALGWIKSLTKAKR